MRVAFIDGSSLDYTVLTPSEQPLGGMQSAACYLALALAARGHQVALLNRTTTPGRYKDIDCIALDTVGAVTLNGFDAIVSISAGSTEFRRIGINRPLIFWTGHGVDQAAVQKLRDAEERVLWDKIVLVSDWQAGRYIKSFSLQKTHISVLRNAVASSFAHQTRSQPYFFVSGKPPVLAYSSTPFRGLEILLRAFPTIRDLVPGCQMKIYSGMAVYQTPPERDDFRPLYELCRRTEGVTYVGPVSQAMLAEEMRNVDVFTYPSIFAETSCISLMEAMASACMIISSNLGALPETSAGFGRLCEMAERSKFARLYAEFTARTIEEAYREPEKWAALLDAQRQYSLDHYSWHARAKEWEELLSAVSRQPVRATVPRRKETCPCGSGKKFKNCCGSSM